MLVRSRRTSEAADSGGSNGGSNIGEVLVHGEEEVARELGGGMRLG